MRPQVHVTRVLNVGLLSKRQFSAYFPTDIRPLTPVRVLSLLACADTRTLITGGRDNGIIRLWRVQSDDNRDIKAAVGGMSMRTSGSGWGRSIAGAGSSSGKW
jgi:hypothetical protein